MEMSNPSNPCTCVQEEDDIEPHIVEHEAPVCYNVLQSSLQTLSKGLLMLCILLRN